MSSSPVPDWVPSDLPGAPGVYRFRNDAGQLLYVGKSVDLKRRVRGYFYGGGPDSDRLAEMLGCASEVEIRRTGSDLEARLLEARAILREQPEYNRALKNSGEAWYLEVDFSVPYPRFRVVQAARKSSARYFGPFRSRKLPRRVARLAEKVFRLRSCTGRLEPDPDGSACIQRGLGLCSAPCVKDTGLNDYREQMEAAVEVLESAGAAADVREKLAERRDRAALRPFLLGGDSGGDGRKMPVLRPGDDPLRRQGGGSGSVPGLGDGRCLNSAPTAPRRSSSSTRTGARRTGS